MSTEPTGEELLGPAGLERAMQLEADDPLGSHRHLFEVPDGVTYLAGNSLGLQPVAARAAVDDVLDAWARRAVDGHRQTDGDHPRSPVPHHPTRTCQRAGPSDEHGEDAGSRPAEVPAAYRRTASRRWEAVRRPQRPPRPARRPRWRTKPGDVNLAPH